MRGTETDFTSSFARALSRTERQLLMLFYAERLTTAEIGLVLDIAQPRVESMLEAITGRARAALGRGEVVGVEA